MVRRRRRAVDQLVEHPAHGNFWVGDAISYIASTGCQRTPLPKAFPPFTTVQYHFYRMRDNGLLDVINMVLVAWVRVSEGCTPVPTAGERRGSSLNTC